MGMSIIIVIALYNEYDALPVESKVHRKPHSTLHDLERAKVGAITRMSQ